jgi:hypothetical protein
MHGPQNIKKNNNKFSVYFVNFPGVSDLLLQEVDQKHLESFEMWCWRRMEKIS